METNPQLDCRRRQQRVMECMQRLGLDWVIVGQHEHVQYLAGPRFHWTFSPWFALRADGFAVLVGPEKRIPDDVAADEIISYVARYHSTLRMDQRQVAAGSLARLLGPKFTRQRVGIEFSSLCYHLPAAQEWVDIEPELHRLRRRKDPDELQKLERAIAATEKMYERARSIVRPGLNELDLFNELQSVAVRELGEPLTATGNDYQCNSRGGAPRNRDARDGELYILDLGPAFRGYFADNARTLAVSEPTSVQLSAWRDVVAVFDMIESTVRPGVSAKSIFAVAQAQLAQAQTGVFNHHLGHGIGLFPHETPHLNPHWDDTFQIGDVFAVEPGLYADILQAGIRIENDYVVTENGVRRLTNFPLELKL